MSHQLPRPTAALLKEMTSLSENENMDQLEKDIKSFVAENQMTKEMYEGRAVLVRLISEWLKSEGVRGQLEPQGVEIKALTAFGSYAAMRCATRDSDIDLCISARSRFQGAQPRMVLEALHRDLESNPESRKQHFAEHTITQIVLISTAKVPIVKFTLDGIPVDLSVTFDTTPPRSTLAALYINAYCQIDGRLAVLVVLLKAWLKSEMSAGDYLRDFPNSYALIMMLIHALQWYGVLPMLEEESLCRFHEHNDWDMLHTYPDFKYPVGAQTIVEHQKLWTSGLSCVQLLKLFCVHYANGSMLSGCQLNMLNGAIERRPRTAAHSSMHIVDRFDARNPARTVRSSAAFVGAARELCNLLERPVKNMFAEMWRIPKEQIAKNTVARPQYNSPRPTHQYRPEQVYRNSMVYYV